MTGPCAAVSCNIFGKPTACCVGNSMKDPNTGETVCSETAFPTRPKPVCCLPGSGKYWNEWGPWTECVFELNTFMQQRTRSCAYSQVCPCDVDEFFDFRDCATTSSSSSTSSTITIKTTSATTIPSTSTSPTTTTTACSPSWAAWSAWTGDCLQTCGLCGLRARTRRCATTCECCGVTSEVEPCGSDTLCPIPTPSCCAPFRKAISADGSRFVCGNASTATTQGCSTSSSGCTPTWSTWSEWSGDCSPTCGWCGKRTRKRACISSCPCSGAASEAEPCGSRSLCPTPRPSCCSPFVKSFNADRTAFVCG